MESSGTRILLTRHGETDWNRIHRFQGRSDLPLNQVGRKQARALALALKDESLTAIYSSPLVRAMETARLIKVFHPSTPLFEEEGLVEMDLGSFDGMEARRWAAEYPEFRKAWQEDPSSVKMPGGGEPPRGPGQGHRYTETHHQSLSTRKHLVDFQSQLCKPHPVMLCLGDLP